MKPKRNVLIPVLLDKSLFRITALSLGLFLCISPDIYAKNGKTKNETKPDSELSVQQNRKNVTVTVNDAMGPLLGANVSVKGTTIGNVADVDGQVFLTDVPDNAILVVSYIGFVTKEVPLGTKTAISVTLE